MPHTIQLHRVFKAPPERVYRAFLDPEAIAKWNPPHGFTAKVHALDVRVGGTYKISFTNFSTGKVVAFTGVYHDLEPNRLIRSSDEFDDPNLPGKIQTTVALKEVSCGTDVQITQEGLPDVIPAEECYLGWQESLTLLGQLVEAEVPDQ